MPSRLFGRPIVADGRCSLLGTLERITSREVGSRSWGHDPAGERERRVLIHARLFRHRRLAADRGAGRGLRRAALHRLGALQARDRDAHPCGDRDRSCARGPAQDRDPAEARAQCARRHHRHEGREGERGTAARRGLGRDPVRRHAASRRARARRGRRQALRGRGRGSGGRADRRLVEGPCPSDRRRDLEHHRDHARRWRYAACDDRAWRGDPSGVSGPLAPESPRACLAPFRDEAGSPSDRRRRISIAMSRSPSTPMATPTREGGGSPSKDRPPKTVRRRSPSTVPSLLPRATGSGCAPAAAAPAMPRHGALRRRRMASCARCASTRSRFRASRPRRSD